MAKGSMLEELREMFRDDRLHMSLAIVKQIEVAADRSVLRVKCTVLPDNHSIVARMSWEAVGPEAGIYQFPSVNDLVMVAYMDGEADQAFVVRRCTSKEDKLPLQAVGGHLVVKALNGKKLYLVSDTRINLTKGGEGPEQAVLGTTFKAAYSQHLLVDATHDHIGNLGYMTSVPNQFQDYLDIKDSPVDDELMLSDLVKLEK